MSTPKDIALADTLPTLDVAKGTASGVYPSMVPAKCCPACGKLSPRRMTKKVLPTSVRIRWMCEGCSTIFDIFHGGR